jgi:cytochrome c oxidase cbb3-type subunit 2
MSLRTFILGLSASFGVAWLAIIVVPYFKMRDLAPVMLDEAKDGATGVFYPKRTGRVADGARVYSENGCYLCHTQVVRPTYAGNDLYRSNWGGMKADPDRGDTRRETNAFDFVGEKFAQIGVTRMGPDFSNLGHRIENEYAKGEDPVVWLHTFIHNPRNLPTRWNSVCPPHPFLYEKREIKGARSVDALRVDAGPDHEWVPSSDAKALASYLFNMKKDQPVPASMNFAPAK